MHEKWKKFYATYVTAIFFDGLNFINLTVSAWIFSWMIQNKIENIYYAIAGSPHKELFHVQLQSYTLSNLPKETDKI